ncbi:hypothetical protein TUBRATIS_23800 [Tubulinosema ratisbonensis]|uniref:Uncharacterized protein n=1 Tax=Tubulinosema ratisbonensis TaxID=291195 RepID=A0A437AJA7_9MICR|nr:hypothetical protein TUBRATIS_23800 [Tubulinosema ratisbonensis]
MNLKNKLLKKRDATRFNPSQKEPAEPSLSLIETESAEKKKLLSKQIRAIFNSFDRFVKCKSENNYELLNNAVGSKLRTFTDDLIQSYDNESKLRDLVKKYQSFSQFKVKLENLERSYDNSMSNLGLSVEDLNDLIDNSYNLITQAESKLKNENLTFDNQIEKEKIKVKLYEDFWEMIFRKIYKTNDINYSSECANLPEYEYVTNHPSCKITPENECCYIFNKKYKLNKRSVTEPKSLEKNFMNKFIINDKQLEFGELQSKFITNENTNVFTNNSLLGLSLLLPVVFLIILVIKFLGLKK